MTIGFRATTTVVAEADLVAVGVPVGARSAPAVPPGFELDRDFLAATGFEGRADQAQALASGDGRTVLAVGVGDRSAEDYRRAGAALTRLAGTARHVASTVTATAPAAVGRERAARALVEGVVLSAYRFSAYKAVGKTCPIDQLDVVGPGARGLQPELDRTAAVAEAVCAARDLVNEPAGALTPARLAEVATEMAERAGLSVVVLDETALAEQAMGALLGVGQGSAQPPRLVRLTYDPPGPPTGDLVLVGKGITFDSGGLSLKPADAMMGMKTDMSGAAAVLAAMSVLPLLKRPVRVVGILPIAENMVSGRSLKPGDVVRARNGTTIEVLNTDAEGRLVLADALVMAAEGRPHAIVDLATLTGAQKVALGNRIAGLMGNSPGLVEQVRAAGERAGEAAWPLPLPPEYRCHIDSDVADLKNIGEAGGLAGALIGGLFLQEFVDGVPWAHLDIAGPARSDKDDGYLKKGGTGWGVRLLVELLTTFEDPDS